MKARPSVGVVRGLVCAGIVFGLVILSGCVHQIRTASPTSPPPASLVDRITDANRIVASNTFARRFSVSISDQRVSRIVKAVSSAKHSVPSDCVFDWDLQFYRDTIFLAKIRYQGSQFMFESDEYYDDTGALRSLYRDLLKRSTPPENR
jgi:hypothetical protein